MSNLDVNTQNFTDSAKRVLDHIAERALDRGMFSGELTESTAEMLAILSMLCWERKVGRAALEQVVSNRDGLARELDDLIDDEGDLARRPSGPQYEMHPSGQRMLVVDTLTPRQRLIDQARYEALGMDHRYVGTEHLLLAAIHLACPRLHDVLERHAVNYDAIRQTVMELLHG